MNAHPLTALLERVPHRHPMLLADRIDVLEPGRRGVATKLVSGAETHGEGCGGAGELPASLLVDALGQIAIAALRRQDDAGGGVWYLASIEGVRVASAARVGESVRMEASVQRSWRGASKVGIRATAGDRLVMEGVMVLSAGTPRTTPRTADVAMEELE